MGCDCKKKIKPAGLDPGAEQERELLRCDCSTSGFNRKPHESLNRSLQVLLLLLGRCGGDMVQSSVAQHRWTAPSLCTVSL